MNNRAFDELVRQTAQKEVFIMTKWSETRIASALNAPAKPGRVRRLTLRTVLALTLLAVLLCGVALAAVGWGVRDLIQIPGGKEGYAPNANLDSYIQPIEKTFTSDALRVEVIDALYDGKALALAWTVENKSDTPLYMICEVLTANGGRLGQGSRLNVEQYFIQPGEVVRNGFVQSLRDHLMADVCDITIAYAALVPTGEVVRIDSLHEDGDDQAYMAHIDALVAEGKTVIAPDGDIELGSAYQRDDEETAARKIVRSGIMKDADALEVKLSLPRMGQMRSGLPEGQPVEKRFDGYTLRVTQCQITPLVVHIEMECLFESADALMRFSPYFETKHGPLWSFGMQADGETDWYGNMGSGFVGKPAQQPDGTWLWRYVFQAMEPRVIPDAVTITAQRDVDGVRNVPFPEESITLTLTK